MRFNFFAMIQGGEGPGVWDKEKFISAVDFRDAANQACALAEELGGIVVSLEQIDWKAVQQWTQTPPTEQGEYWAWSGDIDGSPIHVNVFYSGHSGKCFLPAGQYGWTEARDCDAMEGYWWMKMDEPELPEVTPKQLCGGAS